MVRTGPPEFYEPPPVVRRPEPVPLEVRVRVSGTPLHNQLVAWPIGWPIPPVGARIDLPDTGVVLVVRDVSWLPYGSEMDRTPRVSVTLGAPLPPHLR